MLAPPQQGFVNRNLARIWAEIRLTKPCCWHAKQDPTMEDHPWASSIIFVNQVTHTPVQNPFWSHHNKVLLTVPWLGFGPRYGYQNLVVVQKPEIIKILKIIKFLDYANGCCPQALFTTMLYIVCLGIH